MPLGKKHMGYVHVCLHVCMCLSLPHPLWGKSSFQKEKLLWVKSDRCYQLFSTVLPSHHSIATKSLLILHTCPLPCHPLSRPQMALRVVHSKTFLLGSQLEMSGCLVRSNCGGALRQGLRCIPRTGAVQPCRETIPGPDCWQGWVNTSTWRGLPKLKSSLSRTNIYHDPFKWQEIYCFRGSKSGKAVVNYWHKLEFVGINILPFFPGVYTHIIYHLNPTKESCRSRDKVQVYKEPSRSELAYLSGPTLSTGPSLSASTHLGFLPRGIGGPALIPQFLARPPIHAPVMHSLANLAIAAGLLWW